MVSYTIFSVFSLFIGFGDGRQAAGDAFAVGFQLFFVAETEFNWCSRKIESFA